jgi:cbb3-type cytochrome oxidase maturation protein
MGGLLILVPIALALGLAALVAFLWALRAGQYDDLDGAAGRILFDEELPTKQSPAPSRRLPPVQRRLS